MAHFAIEWKRKELFLRLNNVKKYIARFIHHSTYSAAGRGASQKSLWRIRKFSFFFVTRNYYIEQKKFSVKKKIGSSFIKRYILFTSVKRLTTSQSHVKFSTFHLYYTCAGMLESFFKHHFDVCNVRWNEEFFLYLCGE